jgi:hypothetical protein
MNLLRTWAPYWVPAVATVALLLATWLLVPRESAPFLYAFF